MLPRSFYFLRHGETDWNKQSLIQGHTDIPLNARGRAQAEEAIACLSRLSIDRIVASDLSRAYETASIVNMILQKPLSMDIQLKERNFGAFEGASYAEIERMRRDMAEKGHPLEENGYACPPEGEPYAQFRERTLEAFGRHLDAFPKENILFVTHGGVYRVLKRCLFGDADQTPNAKPFYFEKREKDWFISSFEQ